MLDVSVEHGTGQKMALIRPLVATPMSEPNRATARSLAQASLARGDATGWFETLYEQAAGQTSAIPWADLKPNPNLLAWLAQQPADSLQGRVLVVGCGLGDDAEHLAALGLQVTAFDVSPTAVAWCQQRFVRSPVEYLAADVLAPPAEWRQRFDLIVEIYTMQVLPPEPRACAARNLADCLAPGGRLLVIARGREPHDDPGAMPWPLTLGDLALFAAAGLVPVSLEDFLDDEQPPVRRFRAVYRRPSSK